jgi:hypothetical protein
MSKELARENLEIRADYLSESSDWREEKWDDWDFYHGKHWLDEEEAELEARGQMPLKIDRTSPIIEQKVAIATANDPTWIVRPVGWGADDIRASIRRMILRRVWHCSNGKVQNRDAVEAAFVAGRGILMARVDALADYGRGDIVILSLPNPQDALVDPNCKDRFWETADNIVFNKVMTAAAAKRWLPDETYWPTVDSQKGRHTTEEASHKENRYAGESQKHPDDFDYKPSEKCLIIERYTKEIVTFHVLTSMVPGLSNKEVEKLTDEDKRNIANGYYRHLEIRRPRVRRICSVGDEFLFDEDLPITRYPFAPIIHRHTNNPFSLGEIDRTKDQQKSINARWSILLHDASVATNPRWLIPQNSVDTTWWADHQSLPSAMLEYTPGFRGEKPEMVVPQMQSSMAVLGKIVEQEMYNMEFTAGVPAQDLGISRGAPRTAAQTAMYKEFGNTRVRDFLSTAVEPSLAKLAHVVLEYVPSVYTPEKLMQIVDAELDDPLLTEQQRRHIQLKRDYVGEVLNDITLGRYDIYVEAGSTMATNPMLVQQHYIELANIGAMDREGIIRADPHIEDKEGLIQRLNERDQLKAQVEQLSSLTKRQGQQLQMLQNEVLHARVDRDVAAHKAAMKDEEYKTRAHLSLLRKKADVAQQSKGADTATTKVPRRKLKGEK